MKDPLKLKKGLKALKIALKLQKSNRETLYGSSEWMQKEEMKKLLDPKLNQGLPVGEWRLSEQESCSHLLLSAPTMGGKSSRYVIPALLQCTGSAIVTDPSGEIYKATSGHLAEKGFEIKMIQPDNLAESLRFNPLAHYKKPQELRQLADTLTENATSGNNDLFWKSRARSIIYLCLIALSNIPDQRFNHLTNVLSLLNGLASSKKVASEFMRKFLPILEYERFKSFIAQDDVVVSDALSTAEASLDMFEDENVQVLTSVDTMQLNIFRKKPTVYYLNILESKVKYYSIVCNLIYSLFFDYCLEHPDGLTTYFLLDEFANLGKIRDFTTRITTLRKRKCSISIIVQDISQLETIYGKHESRTILSGGAANRLFFSGQDVDMAKYLEKVLGFYTTFDNELGDKDPEARPIAKLLMSSTDIRTMDRSQAILISGSKLPIRLKMLPFDKDERLAPLAKKPPHVYKPYGESFDPQAQEKVAYLIFTKDGLRGMILTNKEKKELRAENLSK